MKTKRKFCTLIVHPQQERKVDGTFAMVGALGSNRSGKLSLKIELLKEYLCGNQFHLEGKLLACMGEIPPRARSDALRIDNTVDFRRWQGSGEAPSRCMTR